MLSFNPSTIPRQDPTYLLQGRTNPSSNVMFLLVGMQLNKELHPHPDFVG
jgi:hypothetical protein